MIENIWGEAPRPARVPNLRAIHQHLLGEDSIPPTERISLGSVPKPKPSMMQHEAKIRNISERICIQKIR